MKKFKPAVLLCVSILCISLCFAGCSGKQAVSDGDINTFTYWTSLPAVLATLVQSFGEVEMYKYLEEKTGIHIDFIHPAAGQEGEQFNLLLASRDFPDMIEHAWVNYSGGAQKAIDDGVIIALDEYIDNAPNYKATMTDKYELSEIYRRNSTTDSGQYFGFTALNTGNFRIFGGPCVRRDLLAKYNLEMPVTIDDWTNVLTTFKNNGISTPITGSIGNVSNSGDLPFAGAFGVAGRWYLEGDTVKYGPMEDGFKDYLALMNKWYTEGLMDRDIATNQQTLIDSKIVNGDSAALFQGYLGSALGRYLGQKQAEDPAWDLVGADYPVLEKGDINQFPTMEEDVRKTNTIAITTACKDPAKAVAWCDNLYSEEGLMLTNFGVEGKSYNMVEGKPVYVDEILKNPENLSINEALQLHTRATSAAPGFNQAEEYLNQYYAYEQQRESFQKWEVNTAPGRSHKMPNLFSTEEESDIITSIQADLETYVNESLWNFISGGDSLDNYDKFVETLKNQFRIEEYQNILQQQYNRYISK